METQILKLEAPFDYIYCNGEVGKHIATYIVGESRIGEDGKYTLETNITKEPSLCYMQPELTLDEINAEIRAAREERRKKQAPL